MFKRGLCSFNLVLFKAAATGTISCLHRRRDIIFKISCCQRAVKTACVTALANAMRQARSFEIVATFFYDFSGKEIVSNRESSLLTAQA